MSFFDYLCSDLKYMIADLLLDPKDLKKIAPYLSNDGNSYFWKKKYYNLIRSGWYAYEHEKSKYYPVPEFYLRYSLDECLNYFSSYQEAYEYYIYDYEYLLFQRKYLFSCAERVYAIFNDDDTLKCYTNKQDKGGYTLLMFLCRAIEWRSENENPFTPEKCLYYLKKLILFGANVDVQSHSGTTALMYACKDRSIDFVNELIKAGANVNLRNKDNVSALTFVSSIDSKEKRAALLKARAVAFSRYSTIKDHEPADLFKDYSVAWPTKKTERPMFVDEPKDSDLGLSPVDDFPTEGMPFFPLIMFSSAIPFLPPIQQRYHYASTLINKKPTKTTDPEKELVRLEAKTKKQREKQKPGQDKSYQQIKMKQKIKMKR